MKHKQYTAILSAFLMLTSAAQPLPVTAAGGMSAAAGITAEEETGAEEPAAVAEGTIGKTITWKLDEAGTLTLTGYGNMESDTGGAFGSNASAIIHAVIVNADSEHTVTAIGESLFKGCTNLTDVTIPETVTAIGAHAFQSCTSLTRITLPDALASVGEDAFCDSGLTELTLPGCALGKQAFMNCQSLKSVSAGEGTETIPVECFRNCTALESVWLPDSVSSIECGYYSEQGAFHNCPSLRTVSIGKSIASISRYAFRTEGEDLEVTFREGVTAIPESAFYGRNELKKVILPDTLLSVGKLAFCDCASLNECGLPSSLTEIGESAFSGTGLTELVLPGCSLGNKTFFGCQSLKAVTIREGTEIIPSECFRNCTALESVWLPDSVQTIGCGYYSEQGAFQNCPALRTVSIGKSIASISRFAFRTEGEELEITFRKGVSAIPESAFLGRTELTKVVLPDTVTAVSKNAFQDCTNLKECNFPASLTEIGENAFSSTGLTEIELPGCSLGNNAFFRCQSLKTVTIGEGTETIPSECFRYCTVLESVYLPDSVKNIGCGYYSEQGAFADCPALRTVSLGKDIEAISRFAFRTEGEGLEVSFREGVTAIPESAFLGRSELTKVVLPDTVTAVCKNAFQDCTNLKECNFPASLTEIGENAFRNTGLTEIELPGCSLGNNAFFRCQSLKTVTIGEGTEIIPCECFRYCTVLENVYLPDSVRNIDCGFYSEQGAFADCTSLRRVSIGRDIESVFKTSFRNDGDRLEVTFREGVTVIPDHAFDISSVSSLVLPQSMTEINAETLSGNSSLEFVAIYATDCEIADSERTIPQSAIIRGYQNSTAQKYAEKYGRIFIPLKDGEPGICDLNADGRFTEEDVALFLRFLSEDSSVAEELSFDALEEADRNNDGLLNILDASLMLEAIQKEEA